MKTEIKAKWLDALRSGDYKQGTGRLVKVTDEGSKSYCCLGVLCDLAQQEGVVREEPVSCGCSDEDECDVNMLGFRGDNASADGKHRAFSFSVLPYPVMEWAGLDKPDPEVNDEDQMFNRRYLSGLNDSGVDFERIADLIEQDL